LQDDQLQVEVRVPGNTRGTLVLPVASTAGMVLNGAPPVSARIAEGSVWIDLAPGAHTCTMPAGVV
jgi:hypothetical protein